MEESREELAFLKDQLQSRNSSGKKLKSLFYSSCSESFCWFGCGTKLCCRFFSSPLVPERVLEAVKKSRAYEDYVLQ